MSRYDGLIIPRSYSEYLNKTDSATLSQMLQQLTGLWSHAVSAGDNKPVTSDAVNDALINYINKTDAATLQQALQLPGVLSGAVAAGDNKAVTSNAVNNALANYAKLENVEDYWSRQVYVDCNDYLNKNYEYIGSGWQFDNIPIPSGLSKSDLVTIHFISRGENTTHDNEPKNYRSIQEVSMVYTQTDWQCHKYRRFAIDAAIFPWVLIE